ncbi:MAG: hypothetical protein ACP5I1_10655, partial [Candidatus Hinthialibacter sp.]
PQNTRIYWIAAACIIGAIDAFCWGLYLEALRISDYNPLGTLDLTHHLGMAAYCLLSLLFMLICTGLLYNYDPFSTWPQKEKDLYYLCMMLSIVFLMTGYEFLFWSDWRYWDPTPFILAKGFFVGMVVVFLLRVAGIRW